MLKVYKIFFLVSCVVLLISSCKINQYKNGLRSGKWVFRDTTTGSIVKNKGLFKKGIEIGTWKYFENKELCKKEIYTDSIAKVLFYHPNGKIKKSGQTMMMRDSTMSHWFYYGEWKNYNKSGKLILVESYDSGNLIKETPIN